MGSGICAGAESVDMADATAPFSGYLIVVFSDDSVSNQTFHGKVTQSASEPRVSGTGNWELTEGTGRFAGLHGGTGFDIEEAKRDPGRG